MSLHETGIARRSPAGRLLYLMMAVVLMSGVLPGVSAAREGVRASRLSADTTSHVADDTTRQLPRLTVRPHEMATGTRTAQAGLSQMDGFEGYYIYVPAQCVGTQRSPLVVLLHGGGRSGIREITKFQSLADKYGMIVLAGNALQPGKWDVIAGAEGTTKYSIVNGRVAVSAFQDRDVRHLDSAFTRVLRTHAIDPDRIALLGFSDGGSYSFFLGFSNLDIFSRIAALSALIPFDGTGPKNPKTQFFLSGGIGEPEMARKTLARAHDLRQRGHAVVTQIGLRGHVDYVEDEDFIWDWLQKSWADPGVTTSMTTRVSAEADSDPVLTEQILQQMTAFWTRFKQQPASVRTVLRMKHQMQVPLAIGAEPTTVITVNLSALAAAAPSVAALLDSVGLTAQTATAYRNAIIRTGIASMAGMTTTVPSGSKSPFAPIAPASVLGKNLEFWKTHEAAFAELEKTGMWMNQ